MLNKTGTLIVNNVTSIKKSVSLNKVQVEDQEKKMKCMFIDGKFVGIRTPRGYWKAAELP
jgi:hypothetical protein